MTGTEWRKATKEQRLAAVQQFNFDDLMSYKAVGREAANASMVELDWEALPFTVRRTLYYFGKVSK